MQLLVLYFFLLVQEDICYSLYGDSFYKNDYWNINFEHDANIAGYLNTLEDLKELAPHYVEKYDVICKGNCSELKNKLNSVIEIILKEIQTNKNINEKLYILSVILRNNKIEIDQLITDYLRTMQTKYID